MLGSGLVLGLRHFPMVLGPLILLVSCDFIESQLAPAARLDPRWEAHDPVAAAAIDHSAWANFLSTYVNLGADGLSRVTYSRVTEASRQPRTDKVPQAVAFAPDCVGYPPISVGHRFCAQHVLPLHL